MNPIKIIHIDYGTQGNAGLYLAQILKAYSGPIPVDAYVHSAFPQVEAHGRIIRLFDHISRFIPWRLGKQAFKFLDLYICFAWLVLVLRFKARKENLFVFIQFFQAFHAYEWLFRCITRHCTLIVTVHDAVELSHNYPAFIMSPRDDILRYAHFLLVHGSESEEKLSYLLKPIHQIPFPLMMAKSDSISTELDCNGIVRILFIGHIRREKGIDTLINAWRGLPEEILSRASLTIAGSNDQHLDIDFSGLKNCRLVFEYLDDDRFIELIQASHYVVLPYTGGTNSGVLSVATSLNRPCITTRIPLFSDSPFFEESLSFSDPSELSRLLARIISSPHSDYQAYIKSLSSRRAEHQSNFLMQIHGIYDDIICEQQ